MTVLGLRGPDRTCRTMKGFAPGAGAPAVRRVGKGGATMASLSSRALRLVGCAVLLAGLLTSQATADQHRPTVRVSTLKADIDPVTANWLVGQIHAANDDHAAAIVIRLDTPGGLSTSMDDIVQAELASKVPVVV